jgi:hypothetical protein
MPPEANAAVAILKSSNPANPAVYINRPVEFQGPIYYDVDGSSDNSFDVLPVQVEGSTWIATRRLSDPKMKTDISFRLTVNAEVYVIHSTGTFPKIVLREPDEQIQKEAASLTQVLSDAGFEDTGIETTWRGHDMWLADCGLWKKECKAGETINIPGHTLDYVILVKPKIR